MKLNLIIYILLIMVLAAFTYHLTSIDTISDPTYKESLLRCYTIAIIDRIF